MDWRGTRGTRATNFSPTVRPPSPPDLVFYPVCQLGFFLAPLCHGAAGIPQCPYGVVYRRDDVLFTYGFLKKSVGNALSSAGCPRALGFLSDVYHFR